MDKAQNLLAIWFKKLINKALYQVLLSSFFLKQQERFSCFSLIRLHNETFLQDKTKVTANNTS